MKQCGNCGYKQDITDWYLGEDGFTIICKNCGSDIKITGEEADATLPINTIMPIIVTDDNGDDHIFGRIVKRW